MICVTLKFGPCRSKGWSSSQNGELLRRASGVFDVLLTADKRLQYQQNLSQFGIGVVVLATVDTRLPHLLSRLPQIRDAINSVAPGSVITVTTA